MDEILQELRALREEVGGLKEQLGVGARVPRVPKPPRTPCIGVTGKGTALSQQCPTWSRILPDAW